MSEVITEQKLLTVTAGAVTKIHELLNEREMAGTALRVFVSGGGCSGMQYGMAFETNPMDTDLVFDAGDGVKIVLDPVSRPYIEGATIDFVDSLMGGGFKIENPNAVSSCGCGSSFRTDGEGQAHAGGGSCAC